MLHGHAGTVPAIARQPDLVSGTFAICATIFATLLGAQLQAGCVRTCFAFLFRARWRISRSLLDHLTE